MKNNKHSIIAFLLIILLGVPWLVNTYPKSMSFIDRVFEYVDNNIATVFLNKVITVEDLRNKYNSNDLTNHKIRILIMPGHEPDYGGAEYRDLKERDMAVELAKNLEQFLGNNGHYEVIVGRDIDKWNPILQNYFDNNKQAISNFFSEKKTEMTKLVSNGSVSKYSNNIVHNSAKKDVAMRLYGINKWVNDNDVDIAIHIHFNDYPRRRSNSSGEYSGLAIYVPERQYSNSTTTKAIADSVLKRLSKYNAISNMPKEDNGVIEEQDLIAIGSYNTLDAPSMLIEYGYIYEPQFADAKIRSLTMKDLAFQTYLGIQDFFGSGNDVSLTYDTLMLPHEWKDRISKKNFNKDDVFALQTALIVEGLYPAKGMTKNECPRTGKYGECTIEAVDSFQKKYNINKEKDIVGDNTIKVLNDMYSVQLK